MNTILGAWYRDHGQNQEAKQCLLKTAAGNPSDYMNWFNLGNIENDETRYRQATHYYRQALRLNPTYVAALNNLGSNYMELKDYESAKAIFRKVIELNPDYPGGYVDLFSIHANLTRLPQ
jgi:tetratricopeptide (TPR) repeat protein